jgi:hypothetical protein
MSEMNEQDYERGYRAAMRLILGEAVRALGPEGDTDRWRLERADAVAMLRQVCAEHGDNDWPDDLHLGDAIEKHLWRHLERSHE